MDLLFAFFGLFSGFLGEGLITRGGYRVDSVSSTPIGVSSTPIGVSSTPIG
jgi:hypothetical protein